VPGSAFRSGGIKFSPLCSRSAEPGTVCLSFFVGAANQEGCRFEVLHGRDKTKSRAATKLLYCFLSVSWGVLWNLLAGDY
jgi:hypothetical protein